MIHISEPQEKQIANADHQFHVVTRANRLIKLHRQHGASYQVNFRGLELMMLQEVFCPVYGEGSQLLADCLNVQEGERVLEIGTGSGGLAILSAAKAKSVIATDISPIAVKCAIDNVKKHKLNDKIDIRQGDLFQPLSLQEKFSLILFNLPFMNGTPKTWLEVASSCYYRPWSWRERSWGYRYWRTTGSRCCFTYIPRNGGDARPKWCTSTIN